jgi:amino acid transporter
MIKKDRPLVAMVTSLAMGSFLSICALVACTTIMFEEDSHWRAVLLFLPLSLVSASTLLALVQNRWWRNRPRMRSAPWRGARVAGLIAGLLAWRCADIGTWNGLWCGLWVCYSLSPENSADISERTGSSSSEDESAQGGSDGGRSVRGSPSSEGLVVTALFHFVIVIAFATECYFCAAVAILLFIVAVPLECKRSFRDSLAEFTSLCGRSLAQGALPPPSQQQRQQQQRRRRQQPIPQKAGRHPLCFFN